MATSGPPSDLHALTDRQALDTGSLTNRSSSPEPGAPADAAASALAPSATGSDEKLQPLFEPPATEQAEDPLATLIQHKASDLIEAEFLWHPYLLADEFCTLAGPKGAGKSWITMDIATRLTLGTGFPGDDGPKPARSILYGSREGRTHGQGILGRFVGLGADLPRVRGDVDPASSHPRLPQPGR